MSTYWLLVKLQQTSVDVLVPSKRQVLVFHCMERRCHHSDSPMHHSVNCKNERNGEKFIKTFIGPEKNDCVSSK